MTNENVKNRRGFLKLSAGAAAAAAMGVEFAAPARLEAQSVLSPDAALKELVDGNARFAANKMTSFEHDLEI